jgi:hypothetical protein
MPTLKLVADAFCGQAIPPSSSRQVPHWLSQIVRRFPAAGPFCPASGTRAKRWRSMTCQRLKVLSSLWLAVA